ncbi:MAG: hypothetical protein ACE5KJ_06405 [Candidatus Zixiibacteriota bacterium]
MSKLQFEKSAGLGLDIDQLLDLGEGRVWVPRRAKIQRQNPNGSKLSSKYAHILCCSFEKGGAIEQKTGRLP